MQNTEKIPNEQSKRTSSLLSLLGSQNQCPICLEMFDLIKKVPMMICLNQHSSCDQCLEDIYEKKTCPVCLQPLIRRNQVKKNRFTCSLIEELIRAHGEQYIQCSKFKYKGKVKKGKKNGCGEEITDQGHHFKGKFKNGELVGKCEVRTKNGAKFSGDAIGGNFVGSFVTKYGSIVEGNFTKDLAGINCKKKYPNGDIYQGNIKNLKADGFGLMTFKNGNSFEGQFIKDDIHPTGKGKIIGTFSIEINDSQIEIAEIQDQIRKVYPNSDSNFEESQFIIESL